MRSISVLTVLGVAAAIAAGTAQAQTSGYATDSRNEYVKNPFNLCWRAGYWTPAMASGECDPDLVPKPALVAAPAPAAPAPAPKPAPIVPVAERVTLSADVLFAFDKAVLTEPGRKILDDLVAKAQSIALEVVIGIGHADRIGSAAYNQGLSVRRAVAVKSYFVAKGIPENRVYAEGKGETQPVTGDKCRNMGRENGRNAKLVACLQPDRRVEIEVIGTRQR
jgi:OOP family OmpA-OmpF porin